MRINSIKFIFQFVELYMKLQLLLKQINDRYTDERIFWKL